MLKLLFVVLIAWVIYMITLFFKDEWNQAEEEYDKKQVEKIDYHSEPTDYNGFHPDYADQLEASLERAKSDGSAALKQWLTLYRRYVHDPRLAEIELDYVVMVSGESPGEAREVFAKVNARIGTESPAHERVRKLSATYGQ